MLKVKKYEKEFFEHCWKGHCESNDIFEHEIEKFIYGWNKAIEFMENERYCLQHEEQEKEYDDFINDEELISRKE